MKLCPKCQANVEGLIDHCDCCGASLDTRVRLLSCGIHDVPECLGLPSLAFQMIEEIEPSDPAQYAEFLEKVVFRLICYPESMLVDGKLCNCVNYSAAKRYASVTVIINYNDFVFADREEKAALVAESIRRGVSLLQKRLQKNKLSIDEITANADRILKKYSYSS